jgi:hypothetical protein
VSPSPASVYLDDELTLGEFVVLWWADDAPTSDDPDELDKFLDRKQALIRMLRKSRPAFPEPTGTSGRARLYRLGDLESWMTGEGVWPARSDLETRLGMASPLWHLRRAEDACVRELDAGLVRRLEVAVILTLHCLGAKAGPGRQPVAVRKVLSAEDATVEALRLQAPQLERRLPELTGVFDRLLEGIPTSVTGAGRLAVAISDALVSGIAASDLVDITLERLPSALALGGGSAYTASGLSRLMVAAADPHPGEHVLDLAAGQGGLLVYAAEQAGGTVELTGYEADPASWAIAKTRFYLRGLVVDLRLDKSLDGTQPLPVADLVLVDPPLEGRRTYQRWLSVAAGCMAERGRAVVALPAVSLDTSRREWREVGNQVGMVVRVPSRLRVDLGDALALWVLEARPGPDVLLIDASRVGRQRGALSDVSLEEAKGLADTVRDWRTDGRVESYWSVKAWAIPRSELDQSEGELLARKVLGRRSSDPRSMQSDPSSRDLAEAQRLTERLAELVNGPLASYTSEEHRRAVKRLLIRLDHYLSLEDEEADDSSG